MYPPCQYHIRRKFDCTPGSEGKQERLAGCLCVYMRENKQTKVEARGRATYVREPQGSIHPRTSGPKNIEEKNNKTSHRCFLHFNILRVVSLIRCCFIMNRIFALIPAFPSKENQYYSEPDKRQYNFYCLLSSFSIEQDYYMIHELCKHRFIMQPLHN